MLKLLALCSLAALAAAALVGNGPDEPPTGYVPLHRHEPEAEGRFAILTRGFFLDPYAYAGARTVH